MQLYWGKMVQNDQFYYNTVLNKPKMECDIQGYH